MQALCIACSVLCLFAACVSLVACDSATPTDAPTTGGSQDPCLDKYCKGDSLPKHANNEVALKLNGNWYVAPRKYFGAQSNALSFEWWEHRPLDPGDKRPAELQDLTVKGKGGDFAVSVFLRSSADAPMPKGYRLIQQAEANNSIATRTTLRKGLDRITVKSAAGPDGRRLDDVTYYVATEQRDIDGLPMVAMCDHANATRIGGSHFIWKPGVSAGVRMNQRHCADWPEIYAEVSRILSTLKPVQSN